jgi:hypothetical protein
MTTTQTTNNGNQQFKFKVGDDLQVINKVISTLNLAPSDYTYNAKEGTITTSKTTKDTITNAVKQLGFDFLLGNTSNNNYEVKTVTVEKPYINLNSINVAHQKLYAEYKQVLDITETKINHVAKTVTVTANVRIPTFNDLDYKVALILTNFSYVTGNKPTTNEEAYKELYKSIDELIDRVGSDFNKNAPPELKTLVRLFL